jgi:hypothetical protein
MWTTTITGTEASSATNVANLAWMIGMMETTAASATTAPTAGAEGNWRARESAPSFGSVGSRIRSPSSRLSAIACLWRNSTVPACAKFAFTCSRPWFLDDVLGKVIPYMVISVVATGLNDRCQ